MEAFNFGDLDLGVVKTNVRPSADDKPYIRLSETPGRFTLNALATTMLGVQAGDPLMFVENHKATTMDNWLFIGRAVGEDSAKLYSPTKKVGIGYNLSLSQAGTYSRIVQLSPDSRELNAELLEEMGLYVSRQSEKYPDRKNYSSLRTVRFDLVEGPAIELPNEDGDPVEVQLYLLANAKVENLTANDNIVIEEEEEDNE